MHAAAILKLLRGHGCTVMMDGEHLSVRNGKGVLTDTLRQAIASEKAAIMAILAAEQVHAPMPSDDDIAAIKVWSEALQEPVWVVADGVPIAEYLGEGKVFTHHEIRVLRAHGRGVKAWAAGHRDRGVTHGPDDAGTRPMTTPRVSLDARHRPWPIACRGAECTSVCPNGWTVVPRVTRRHVPPTGFQPILIPQGCMVPSPLPPTALVAT
jgi:TubC N-terminal docking domain